MGREIKGISKIVDAPVPGDEKTQIPVLPAGRHDGRPPDERFDRLQPGGAPRSREGDTSPRQSGGLGGRPPRGLPPTGQGAGDADGFFNGAAGLHDALQEAIRKVVAAGSAEAASALSNELSKLIAGARQLDFGGIMNGLRALFGLQNETKKTEILDGHFVELLAAGLQAGLEALASHIARHPLFDNDQFHQMVNRLNVFQCNPGVISALLAVMQHVDPDKGIPIAKSWNNDLLFTAFDALRNQPASEKGEQLCQQLAPYLARQCRDYDAIDAASLLVGSALPALEPMQVSPGSRALLQALEPFVHRFFNETIPGFKRTAKTLSFDSTSFPLGGAASIHFAGFDVLDALRGLKNLKVTLDGPPLSGLEPLLTSIDQAVTARSLSPRSSNGTVMWIPARSGRNGNPATSRCLPISFGTCAIISRWRVRGDWWHPFISGSKSTRSGFRSIQAN